MTPLIKAIDDLCFMDSETRRVPDCAHGDVSQVGGYRYFDSSFATMWTWGVGTNPVEIAALDDGFHERLSWDIDAPDWLKRFYDKAEKGEAFFAAWNMAFDRGVWNGPESDFPPLRPDMTIDVMAQAAVAGTPTKLGDAAQWLGVSEKMKEGKDLIKLFEPPNGSTPQDRPKDWAMFREYGIRDTVALREIYQTVLPLSREEWEVYWANEEINDRGIKLDTELCAKASVLVDTNMARMAKQIEALTGGRVTAVTQAKRILDFIVPVLSRHSEAYDYLVKNFAKLDDEGTEIRPEKLSLSRDRLEQVLAFLDNLDQLTPEEVIVRDLLVLRHYGGSTTPGKFLKALEMSHKGRLKGQYVFNGAPQTHRFCVDADTPVLTHKGPRRIVDLRLGDCVVTHRGRLAEVEGVMYKGREAMYRVSGPRGEEIICTRAHRILTMAGWRRIDECFEASARGHGVVRTDRVPVSDSKAYEVRYSAGHIKKLQHSFFCAETALAGGGIEATPQPHALAGQERLEESYVWGSDSRSAYKAARLRGCVEWQGVHYGAPSSSCRDAWLAGTPATSGSASHRRGQDAQRSRQLGDSYATGARSDAPGGTWRVEFVGERDVWDISVAGDHSYVAGGMIHANSSRGVQIHNLTRSHLGDQEAAAINGICSLEDERVGLRLNAAGY